jgi:hypothetical protein
MHCVSSDTGTEVFKLYLNELRASYINVQVRDEIEFNLHQILCSDEGDSIDFCYLGVSSFTRRVV